MRLSARILQKRWGVFVRHGLFHHEGTWYHVLKEFPAALFDPHGYVRFETQDEYAKNLLLSHGAHLHVSGGISRMPNYVRITTDSEEPLPLSRGKKRGKESPFVAPEEIDAGATYHEGCTMTVQVNVFERNKKARRQCIAHHGAACAVCGFEFEARFGSIGVGFIHIHHLRELASIGARYEVDPKNDLRPVCPNCHAMLHRRSPSFSVEELKALISAR